MRYAPGLANVPAPAPAEEEAAVPALRFRPRLALELVGVIRGLPAVAIDKGAGADILEPHSVDYFFNLCFMFLPHS